MNFKINKAYQISEVREIIPRSHFKSGKGANFAIFQDTIRTETGYKTKMTTFSAMELRKMFNLEKGEKVNII